MSDMIMELKLMQSVIWSSVGMMALFLGSVIFLAVRYRKNQESQELRRLLIYTAVTVVLACMNPVLAKLMLRFTGDEYTFVRFAWLVPAFPVIAYSLVQLWRMVPKKRQGVALVMITAVLVCCGSFWPNVYRKPENVYKVPDNLVDACEVIRADVKETGETNVYGHVTVNLQLKNNDIYVDGSEANVEYFGVRQYAPEFELSSSSVTKEQGEDENFNYQGYLVNYAQYAISDNTPVLQREYERIGYVVIGKNTDYIIYRNNLDLTLYVLRHGETVANAENRVLGRAENEYSQLTEVGIQQAKTTGEALEDVPFVHAYTSQYQRTIDTAAYALTAAGQVEVPTTQTDTLSDIGWGAAECDTWDEIYATYGEGITLEEIFGPAEDADYHDGPIPQTNNLYAYMNWITSGVSNVLTDSAVSGNNDSNVMIVTHSAFHWWLQKVFPAEGIPNGLENASVTIVKFHHGTWKLVTVSETDPQAIHEAIQAAQ